jgi:hypothetical protein
VLGGGGEAAGRMNEHGHLDGTSAATSRRRVSPPSNGVFDSVVQIFVAGALDEFEIYCAARAVNFKGHSWVSPQHFRGRPWLRPFWTHLF